MWNKLVNFAISFFKNLFPDGLREMITIPIAEAEIIYTVGFLKNKSSTGHNEIFNSIFKICGV
jgi:hypothetical protein